MRFLLHRGRSDYSWTALRGGQETINKSLEHELCTHRTNIARSIARLRRMHLIEIGMTIKDRQSIRITERMHALAMETQWRILLWDTDPQGVMMLAHTPGWRLMLEAIDRFFQRHRSKRPSRFEDRRAALESVEPTTTL